MSYSKRQFVEKAYEKIGIAKYSFDISPEMETAAVEDLDAMMGEWNGRGIRLGYPMPGSPEDTDLDAPTVVPNWAWSAVYLNLAIMLSDSLGKAVSPETKTGALRAYNTVMSRSITIPQVQMPASMPSGAGNRWRGPGWNYVVPPSAQSISGPDDGPNFE